MAVPTRYPDTHADEATQVRAGVLAWQYIPVLCAQTCFQRKFFTILYSELDKVAAFFNEREADAAARYRVLQDQLEELVQHRLRHEQPHGIISKSIKRPVLHATGRSTNAPEMGVTKVENFANARKSLRSALAELYKLLTLLTVCRPFTRQA